MKMITVTEYAKRYGCSTQYIRRMLSENRITGARKIGFMWVIPENAQIRR